MLRNKIGPIFNARNGSFVLFRFLLVFENPLLSAGRMRFSKKKKTKNMDQFLTLEKANLDQLLTLQHIYIYICML